VKIVIHCVGKLSKSPEKLENVEEIYIFFLFNIFRAGMHFYIFIMHFCFTLSQLCSLLNSFLFLFLQEGSTEQLEQVNSQLRTLQKQLQDSLAAAKSKSSASSRPVRVHLIKKHTKHTFFLSTLAAIVQT